MVSKMGKHEGGEVPVAGLEHVRQPYWYHEGRDMSPKPLVRSVPRR